MSTLRDAERVSKTDTSCVTTVFCVQITSLEENWICGSVGRVQRISFIYKLTHVIYECVLFQSCVESRYNSPIIQWQAINLVKSGSPPYPDVSIEADRPPLLQTFYRPSLSQSKNVYRFLEKKTLHSSKGRVVIPIQSKNPRFYCTNCFCLHPRVRISPLTYPRQVIKINRPIYFWRH